MSQITGYVYLVTNLVNGKSYVGCTITDIRARWAKHLGQARRSDGYALHAAIQKHGEHNFSVECIETVVGRLADLFAAERRQIIAHGSRAPNGYNLTPGGDGVDLSVPDVSNRRRKAYEAAMQRMHADPAWLATISASNRDLAQRPDWQKAVAEAARRRADDPEWQKANAEKNQRVHADPSYLETMRELPKDPAWQEAFSNGLSKRSGNPAWREKNAEILARGRTTQALRIALREAGLPPEEQIRRARRRERDRVRKALSKQLKTV